MHPNNNQNTHLLTKDIKLQEERDLEAINMLRYIDYTGPVLNLLYPKKDFNTFEHKDAKDEIVKVLARLLDRGLCMQDFLENKILNNLNWADNASGLADNIIINLFSLNYIDIQKLSNAMKSELFVSKLKPGYIYEIIYKLASNSNFADIAEIFSSQAFKSRINYVTVEKLCQKSNSINTLLFESLMKVPEMKAAFIDFIDKLSDEKIYKILQKANHVVIEMVKNLIYEDKNALVKAKIETLIKNQILSNIKGFIQQKNSDLVKLFQDFPIVKDGIKGLKNEVAEFYSISKTLDIVTNLNNEVVLRFLSDSDKETIKINNNLEAAFQPNFIGSEKFTFKNQIMFFKGLSEKAAKILCEKTIVQLAFFNLLNRLKVLEELNEEDLDNENLLEQSIPTVREFAFTLANKGSVTLMTLLVANKDVSSIIYSPEELILIAAKRGDVDMLTMYSKNAHFSGQDIKRLSKEFTAFQDYIEEAYQSAAKLAKYSVINALRTKFRTDYITYKIAKSLDDADLHCEIKNDPILYEVFLKGSKGVKAWSNQATSEKKITKKDAVADCKADQTLAKLASSKQPTKLFSDIVTSENCKNYTKIIRNTDAENAKLKEKIQDHQDHKLYAPKVSFSTFVNALPLYSVEFVLGGIGVAYLVHSTNLFNMEEKEFCKDAGFTLLRTVTQHGKNQLLHHELLKFICVQIAKLQGGISLIGAATSLFSASIFNEQYGYKSHALSWIAIVAQALVPIFTFKTRADLGDDNLDPFSTDSNTIINQYKLFPSVGVVLAVSALAFNYYTDSSSPVETANVDESAKQSPFHDPNMPNLPISLTDDHNDVSMATAISISTDARNYSMPELLDQNGVWESNNTGVTT